MRRRLRLPGYGICCLAAWLGLGCAAAQAQAVAGTLNGFGFFGSWAVQCGSPAPTNIIREVKWTGHEPVEFIESYAGATTGNHYRVLSAQMPNPTTLQIQVLLNGRIVENLTIAKYSTNWIRTMTNQTSQGFVVQNGVVAASGQPTPWLQKCR